MNNKRRDNEWFDQGFDEVMKQKIQKNKMAKHNMGESERNSFIKLRNIIRKQYRKKKNDNLQDIEQDGIMIFTEN